MRFEPKKKIGDIDLTCYTGSAYDIAVMGTNAAYSKLKPFLELQQQMAQQHGLATRTVFFRRPWNFSAHPFSPEEIRIRLGRHSRFELTYLNSMEIKLEVGLTQGSIRIDKDSVIVHCSEHSFAEMLNTCTRRSTEKQTHGRDFITFSDHESGIMCPPLGDWIGME